MKSLFLLSYLCTVSALQVYVGSLGSGIWIYSQGSDGKLKFISNPEKTSSGFLAIHGNNLYATGANDQYVSYSLGQNGSLKRLNSKPGHDGNECWATHVSIHPTGKYLFGANYKDGSFISWTLNSNGSLEKRILLDTPGTGSKGDKTDQHRQDGPHAHMILASPDPSFIVGMDLGADRIWVWKFNETTGEINRYSRFKAYLGSGSRHIAFSPTKPQFAFVVNEIACTVLALSFHKGYFWQTQSISSLQQDQQGDASISAGEIRVHPNGKFLYVTNRNGPSNNIGAFLINQNNGTLTPIDWVWSHAVSPRGMNIDPSGKYLYVANENTDNNGNSLFLFKIDQDTGKLNMIEGYNTGGSCSDVEFGN